MRFAAIISAVQVCDATSDAMKFCS